MFNTPHLLEPCRIRSHSWGKEHCCNLTWDETGCYSKLFTFTIFTSVEISLSLSARPVQVTALAGDALHSSRRIFSRAKTILFFFPSHNHYVVSVHGFSFVLMFMTCFHRFRIKISHILTASCGKSQCLCEVTWMTICLTWIISLRSLEYPLSQLPSEASNNTPSKGANVHL